MGKFLGTVSLRLCGAQEEGRGTEKKEDVRKKWRGRKREEEEKRHLEIEKISKERTRLLLQHAVNEAELKRAE